MNHMLKAKFLHDHSCAACFDTMDDLSIKKCVPCNSEDMPPMTEEAANGLIPKVPGWNLVIDDDVLKLHQSWKVKSFTKGLEFFQEVAKVAEAEESLQL